VQIERENSKGCDMRTTWCVIFFASAMMATIDGLLAQPEKILGGTSFSILRLLPRGIRKEMDPLRSRSASP
jgi:hypothetical protein